MRGKISDMLKKNDILELEIQALNSDMQGIARHEGKVVFLPFSLPGEIIRAKIVKVLKSYAYAKPLEILQKSPDRQEPPCDIFYKCGGCTCQHMTYETTLIQKRLIVKDTLSKIAGAKIPVAKCIDADSSLNYRNKTSMPLAFENGKPVAGFFYPRSHRVVPVTNCPVARKPTMQVMQSVLSWMEEYNIPPYNENAHTGLIRHIVIRVNLEGECMLILVTREKQIPYKNELISRLKQENPYIVSIISSVQKKRTNTILGESFAVLHGENHIKEELLGLNFRISPLSFFQINTKQAEKLYLAAMELAGDLEGKKVLDLYCGAGTIALSFAGKCKEVRGIEIVPAATDDAILNAKDNNITNASFHLGKVEDILPQFVKENYKPDIIVLDPPRKGAEPSVIEAMAKLDAEKIIYISCHVASQARDIARLTALGYAPTKSIPVDMFSYTSGIENIVLLQKA